MKIECKIKREPGTIVDMPNGDGKKPTRYHFRPLDPRDPDSPHVAEVSAKHASMFFRADANVYVPYEAPPTPAFQPPAPQTRPETPPATTEPQGDQTPEPAAGDQGGGDGDGNGGDSDSDSDGDSDEAPEGALTLRQLRAGIGSGELGPEKLRELLEAEQQSEKPRSSFIDIIVKALK